MIIQKLKIAIIVLLLSIAISIFSIHTFTSNQNVIGLVLDIKNKISSYMPTNFALNIFNRSTGGAEAETEAGNADRSRPKRKKTDNQSGGTTGAAANAENGAESGSNSNSNPAGNNAESQVNPQNIPNTPPKDNSPQADQVNTNSAGSADTGNAQN